jgi:hypothetical protein
MHPHRHARPGLGSQRDLPVDPGGLAPSIALRHLPHADQRVRPAPQHQPLQVPDFRPVLLLRRLEDPLPQPPYVLLTGTPVNGGPLQPVLGSVHRHRRLTCPSVPAVTDRPSSTAHLPTSAPFRARAPGPVSGQLYKGHPAEEPGVLPRFPAAFRLPAFASWASCPARGFRPPCDRPTAPPASSADPDGVSVFRTRETRLGLGALCTPGAAVPARPVIVPGRRLPHHNGTPLPPWTATRPRM